ncbi:fimbrial protein [Siccibacter turicensis]|uniref:fimbrial protein n=1 Tax=Siccibacter turicensis TaxID=357233 RepID=UPI003F550059
MTNAKYYASLLLMGWALYAGMAKAADITLNFNATVVASPCELDLTNSTTTIALGDVYANQVAAPGSRSDEVQFDLSFKDCPVGTTSIVATFTGTDNPETFGGLTFLNTGTAENIGVQLKPLEGNWDGKSFHSGSTMTTSVAADKTAVFKLASRMYTPTGNVTPGSVIATVSANFTYQ